MGNLLYFFMEPKKQLRLGCEVVAMIYTLLSVAVAGLIG